MEDNKKFELNDDTLDSVSGGVTRIILTDTQATSGVLGGSMLRGPDLNSVGSIANSNIVASGFEGMDIPAGNNEH